MAGEDGVYSEPEPLDADLVLVDEASMLDIYLAENLFRSLKPGCQVVLVGDTAFDVLGAKVHGIPTIGVTWGYGQVEAMREAGAAALADTPEQLEALLHTPGIFSPAPPQALP